MENVLTEKNFQRQTDPKPAPMIVKFTNFSNEDFTWTWNGIPYTFPAQSVKFMETGLANHFAKHLVNRELLKRGRENDTSPKVNSEGRIDNPFFLALYNQCIEPVNTDGTPMDQTKAEQEAIDLSVKTSLASKEMHSNIESPKPVKPVAPLTPNVGAAAKAEEPAEEKFEEIIPPDFDEDEVEEVEAEPTPAPVPAPKGKRKGK
jgi:hypothetical protein